MLLLTYSRLIATNVVLDIALLETYKEGIEIRCANSFKQRCYPLLAGLMVDYKEQVFITGVKANMQFKMLQRLFNMLDPFLIL